MEHYVITISRRFGSMGHAIAKKTGEELGIPVYDRGDVEAEVRRQGLDVRLQAEHERQESRNKETRDRKSLRFFRKEREEEDKDQAVILFRAQSQVMREFVEKNSCVLLGRAGDEVFRDYGRCLSVYVYASDEVRLANCLDLLSTDEEAARALIRREDQAREAYRSRFCGKAQDPTYGRQLLIDSGRFGVDESVRLITEAARYLFDIDDKVS